MMIYCKFGVMLDDYCGLVFDNYVDVYGIDCINYVGEGGCFLINLGCSNIFLVDYVGMCFNYIMVMFIFLDIGYLEKFKCIYLVLDFLLEYLFFNGWYGKVIYIWLCNKGNMEGQIKFDIGQIDVLVIEIWDFLQLMENVYGYLFNDCIYQIYVFGYYQVNLQIMVGVNFMV